ncbi:MAG: hypothetical protein RL885_28470 [Planctomycetota bacterium]
MLVRLVWMLALALPAAAQDAPEPIVFAALGDVPYSNPEYPLLEKQLASLAGQVDFAVHVGDIKPGTMPCLETIYVAVAKILEESPVPCFVLPGDNEWNDCLKPAEAKELWVKHLARLDARWTADWGVTRDEQVPGTFCFERQGVLFLGLNLLGGRVDDAEEWKQRHARMAKWVEASWKAHPETRAMVVFGHAQPSAKHQDFFDAFTGSVIRYGKPVLYLHGDGHLWTWAPDFGPANLLRVQVDQGAIAPPVRVTVTHDPDRPFRIDRRLDIGPPIATKPIPFTHAHNDYEHPRPLLDALDQGFTSVEADVFLRNDALMIGHTWLDLRRGRTLEALYLEPLWQRFQDEGTIIRSERPFQLLIDFKTDASPTWAALQKKLEPYRPMLTRIENGELVTGAVTIAISGNRPVKEILEAKDTSALLDGRLGDWRRKGFDPQRFALVSTSWSEHFPNGSWDEAKQQKLEALAQECHQHNMTLRFWGTPDDPAVWKRLRAARVDWLQADDLVKLRQFRR